ncbi:MAG: AI-2E family transporter [Clostridia bacterium]|nr:AI-2E family transporter [Clostridia bacterium]
MAVTAAKAMNAKKQLHMVSVLSVEWKRKLTILGIVAGTFLTYRYLLPVILPFLAAWLLAAWLNPYALRLQSYTRIKKNIWNVILLATVFAILVVLLYLGAKELLGQLKTAVANFSVLLSWASVFLDKGCALLEDVTGIAKESSRAYILSHLSGMQEEFLAALSPRTFARVSSAAKKIVIFFSGIVVTFIGAILMMADMENLHRKIWDYSWLVSIRRVVNQLKRTTAVYLKAQVIIMLIVAGICAAGFWIMKSPYFLILGIVLGLLDALPVIGTGTFLYPAAFLFLIKGNFAVAAGCVLLDVITSILREYLEPKLLGGKLGISPIAVLASVYIGIFLYGGCGVFLGPLSFSTIYESGKVWDVWD